MLALGYILAGNIIQLTPTLVVNSKSKTKKNGVKIVRLFIFDVEEWKRPHCQTCEQILFIRDIKDDPENGYNSFTVCKFSF